MADDVEGRPQVTCEILSVDADGKVTLACSGALQALGITPVPTEPPAPPEVDVTVTAAEGARGNPPVDALTLTVRRRLHA